MLRRAQKAGAWEGGESKRESSSAELRRVYARLCAHWAARLALQCAYRPQVPMCARFYALTLNQRVVGSIPTRPTSIRKP